MRTSEAGYTVRTKLYNNMVSNFEAGEVREPIGGYLADYVDCPNEHLRRTFLHPDEQAQGCTCIEVSLHACCGRDLSAGTAEEVVSEALALVSPPVSATAEQQEALFVVQPPAKQWANLAACLDRCLVLADRPQGSILVAWYAYKTGRVSGVRVQPTKAKADNDATWERAVERTAANFGFRACPIFRVDILAAGEEGVELPTPMLYQGPRRRHHPGCQQEADSCIGTAPTLRHSCRLRPLSRGAEEMERLADLVEGHRRYAEKSQ
ncbi:MAG: hypothetical protein AB2556_24270 [Candidatus Thiodiazotropha sp.]